MSTFGIYEPTIGIEVHTQLLSRTKAFCTSSLGNTESMANTHVGVSSAGLPGSLPALNFRVAELAVRAGIALNCEIQPKSVFARKHYFYPDLPKGYQISQFSEPICTNGFVDLNVKGQNKRIRIERIHIEEDAGKLTHAAGNALVDLNRAGVPLVEIVSHADMSSVEEAVAYIRALHETLVFAGVTDGNMEAGNFRADVNVSIKKRSDTAWGTRAELKNINSFRFVEAALDFEIQRQIAIIDSGGRVIQETRGWDEASKTTYTLRSKEDAPDYRYFPDPDLPPLRLSPEFIEGIRRETPELPNHIRARLHKDHDLPSQDIERLLLDKNYVAYLDACIGAGAKAREACNWFFSELLRELHEAGQKNPFDGKIPPQHLAELLSLIDKGSISGKMAKSLFKKMWESGKGATELAKAENASVIADPAQIQSFIDEVMKAQTASVDEYRSGKVKVFDFLVGQVMRLSKGKADPELARDLLKKSLG